MADERHDGMKMACMFIFMTMMIFRFKTTPRLLFETRKTDIFGMIHSDAAKHISILDILVLIFLLIDVAKDTK